MRDLNSTLRLMCLCLLGAGCFVPGCSNDGAGSDATPNDAGADVSPPADVAPPEDLAAEANTSDGAAEGPVSDGPVSDGPASDGPAADVGGTDSAPGDASAGDLFGPIADGFNPANYPACNGKIYACSDGQDNDGDGLTDAQDIECTGPCDDDEGSFEIGIPGVNSAICKQDCYWDDDSGSGNDGCEWSLKCDPKSPGAQFSPPCPFDQSFVDGGKCLGDQSQVCLDFCKPITPNGCDCFGCCEIWTPSGKYPDTVYLGSGAGCTAATPQNCAACTQVPECLNACGDCQLCLGKTLADLPAKCWQMLPPADAGPVGDGAPPVGDGAPPVGDGAPPVGDGAPPQDGGLIILPIQCPTGQDPCLDNSYCKTGYYCVTGCCKSFIN